MLHLHLKLKQFNFHFNFTFQEGITLREGQSSHFLIWRLWVWVWLFFGCCFGSLVFLLETYCTWKMGERKRNYIWTPRLQPDGQGQGPEIEARSQEKLPCQQHARSLEQEHWVFLRDWCFPGDCWPLVTVVALREAWASAAPFWKLKQPSQGHENKVFPSARNPCTAN